MRLPKGTMAYEKRGGSNPPPSVKKHPPNVKLGSLVRWTLLPIFFFFLTFWLFYKQLHRGLKANMFHQTSNWCFLKTGHLAKMNLQLPW